MAGVGWSLLLVYVLSSLKWQPGDITDTHQRSAHANQADNVPLARAAKSHVRSLWTINLAVQVKLYLLKLVMQCCHSVDKLLFITLFPFDKDGSGA